jgi:hypothetical protein
MKAFAQLWTNRIGISRTCRVRTSLRGPSRSGRKLISSKWKVDETKKRNDSLIYLLSTLTKLLSRRFGATHQNPDKKLIATLEKSWQSWPTSLFHSVFAGLNLANLVNTLCERSPDPALTTDRRSPVILFTSLPSRPCVQKSSHPCQSSRDFARLRPFLVFHRLCEATFHFFVVKKFARLRASSPEFDRLRTPSLLPGEPRGVSPRTPCSLPFCHNPAFEEFGINVRSTSNPIMPL